MHTPLRVGFDLDGVLLYNPARIFRPVTIVIKKLLTYKAASSTDFYYPKSPIEQFVWRIIHWSSLCIAPGFDKLEQTIGSQHIEAYIVTSRYDCLKDDFQKWVRHLNKHNIFIDAFHNEHNMQPHEFKVKKINELRLDMFVEDNWNIVQYIARHTAARPLWITNALDKHIVYPYKFDTLRSVVDYLQSDL